MKQRSDIRGKTLKLLGENVRVNLHTFEFGNVILYIAPKPQATKEKQVN